MKRIILILLALVSCLSLFTQDAMLIYRQNYPKPLFVALKDISTISHSENTQVISLAEWNIHAQSFAFDIDSLVFIDSDTLNDTESAYFTCPNDHHPHMIDLGLPSGTLWSCCNVGASAPEEYGGYYAWGETEEKDNYDWSTYIHCDGSYSNLYYIGDDISNSQFDVAHVKWGGSWCMPTENQFYELKQYCKQTETTQNGVKGILFTGVNGASIFMPLAGSIWSEKNNYFDGSEGYYWSSNISPSTLSSSIGFHVYDNRTDRGSRNWGQTVRAVIHPKNMSHVEPNCPVAEAIDLGLPSGTKWASWNVGASAPEELGGYYAWGETETKKSYSWNTYIYRDDTFSEYRSIGDDIARTQYDVAHVKWGGDWQMPSNSQIQELINFCTHKETKINGVSGMKFTGRNGASIFMPYNELGVNECWSSTIDVFNDQAITLHLYLDSGKLRCYGLPVRAVWRQDNKTHAPFTCPDDNHPHMVDLGLPSGIKWACCNVGANGPEEYGGYYAWGETEEKDYYAWSTYIHCDGTGSTCHHIGDDIAGTEYDVAHVKWGGPWRMPSYDQMDELFNNSILTWTSQDGINGYLVTGPNGSSIFLPASDSITKDKKNVGGQGGCYWSSCLYQQDERRANLISFNSSRWYWDNDGHRYIGNSVRPIVNQNDYYPEPEAIDLGLPSGTKWASWNVGASKPEEYGGYYAWGETEEKENYSWGTYLHCDGKQKTCHNIGDDIARTQYDVAHVKWGGDWQMPSNSQIQELIGSCTSTRTTKNGVEGILFKGPNGATIFLPSGGYYQQAIIENSAYGYYWSSTLNQYQVAARNLFFGKDYLNASQMYRNEGLSIRAVSVNNSKAHLVITHNSVNLTIGNSTVVEITSGSGKYEIINSNTNIIDASLSGSTITLSALSIGKAVITVKDTLTGQTVGINVSVSSSNDWPIAEAIDLGLPSGTKWASWNVGASAPEENGAYYAWGETEEKEYYDWNTYSHCDGSRTTLHQIGEDIAGTEFDVAHVKWGGSWRMPSIEQVKELISSCYITWTIQNGVRGILVKGPNGATIFIPANGYHWNDNLEGVGSYGYYWTSSLNPQDESFAYYLDFSSSYWECRDYYRYRGRSIRAVCVGDPFPNLTISKSIVELIVGNTTTVEITSGSGNYEITNSNTTVIEATLEGTTITIKGLSGGSAVVTVKDLSSGQTAKIDVSVSAPSGDCPVADAIDLGLPSGTKWASWNVGASAPEEYGGYYAWGETEEKDYYDKNTYKYYDNGYIDIGEDIAGTQYDVAHVKWGGSWRMPSIDQMEELIDNCTWKWTTRNGVNGQLVTGKNGNSIFLPAAGVRDNDELAWANSDGEYWSSSLFPHNYSFAYLLHIDTNYYRTTFEGRRRGFSVRAVCP